jgi:hypothetical protein
MNYNGTQNIIDFGLPYFHTYDYTNSIVRLQAVIAGRAFTHRIKYGGAGCVESIFVSQDALDMAQAVGCANSVFAPR